MKRTFLAGAVAAAAFVAAASPAFAQLSPEQLRPYRGLFGGGNTSTELGHDLSVTGAMGAGFEDDLGRPAVGLGKPLRAGFFTTGAGNLRYSMNSTSFRAGANLRGHVRYYPSSADPFFGTFNAGGFLGASLGSRTSIDGNFQIGRYEQNLAYYSGAMLPGLAAAGVETLVEYDIFYSARSDISVNHQLTKRISLHGGYSHYTNGLTAAAGAPGRYGAQSAQASVSVGLAKGLGAHLGYSHQFGRNSQVPGQSAYQGRSIDFGVDFSKPLALSRRTTLGFSTGLSGVRDEHDNQRYFLVGSVRVSYDLGRTWGLSGQFHRSVDFYQLLQQPVFLDSMNASVNGLISRRIQAGAGVGITRGTVGIVTAAEAYVAANANATLRYAFTQSIGLGVAYTYYRYQMDQATPLPPGLLSSVNRQSIRVSVDVWAPILSRRANASR